jgi:hypothetical protein
MLIIALLAQLVGAPAPVSTIERDCLRQLLTLRRVYVDHLNGGETADQMRDMLINSLQNSRLFVITEDQERADASLRGSAEDLVFSEQHQSSDSINAHLNMGMSRTNRSSASPYGGSYGSNSSTGGLSIGESDSMHSSERRHEASASVRLVNKDGDVIWSATEESLGGKYRGASADVAEKITSRLAGDYNKARKIP